ncbi:unnamed protein product [Pneumocystis jirovecii]|uniref:Cullin family profile domain-containing protein n=1 Tax=Pneumocystis jirovecii TaxID=42068 RepID=L0PCE9_PNEJI|nr:unnamed protein product [Pneumocystis jirovecii]
MNNQKLKIKAPKKLEKQALEYEWNISWNFLSQAIKEIYKNNTSMLSFEELYRNVYNSVLHKQEDKLYNGIKSVIQEHLENISNFDMQLAYKKVETLNQINITSIEAIEIGTYYLQTLKNIWDEYILCTNMISHIMKYMDKVCTKQANKLKIYDTCIILFRDYIIKYEKIPFGKYAIMIILNQIRFERQGNKINKSSIKSCVNIFNSLPNKTNENKTVFESDVEVYILLETRKFYIKESKKLLELSNVSQYLIQCEKRLEEEYNRTKNYFPFQTGPKIKRIVEEEMILNNMSAIIKIESSGLFFMLDNEKFEDLNRLYRLFISVDLNLVELRKSILTKIIELGETINSKINNMLLLQKEKNQINKKIPTITYALTWVNNILQLKDKYNKILKFAFQNDKNIQNTINDAFSRNINKNPKSIEFISIFINENLKKTHKKGNDANIILDKAIILFKYIKDKDIFEEYYKSYLAKRLLRSYSISNDTERYMITKLKYEAGYRFTTKLEGMFRDIQLSKNMTLDYKNMLKLNSKKTSFKLNVAILTSIFWPITTESNNSTCIYPQQIEEVKKTFESFYLSKHNGRQLLWQGNMGNSDLKILLKSNIYEINVSTYSMIILLLFNNISENGFLSYNDIQMATLIPKHELTKNLKSLISEKYKILLKFPNSENIEVSDRFLFNKNISFSKKKMKILTIKNDKIQNKEHKNITENIEESRKYQIEAAIIRIMKNHKTLDHAILVEEITKKLSQHFVPNPSIIKKRIESLIEREYMQRHDENRTTYNYIA